MTKLVDVIGTLGEVAELDEWLDYQQYDFDDADAGALLAMIVDYPRFMAAESGDASWIPLHAWRALGQLNCKVAVAPLIAQFNHLHEDDWAYIELPQVLAMLGETALSPLAAHLLGEGNEEFARAMALEALVLLQQANPQLRGQVEQALRNYLAAVNAEQTAFNGLLVGEVADLGFTELLPQVEKIFNAEQVDTDVCGDLAYVNKACAENGTRIAAELAAIDKARKAAAAEQAKKDAKAKKEAELKAKKEAKARKAEEAKAKKEAKAEEARIRKEEKAKAEAEAKAKLEAEDDGSVKRPTDSNDVIGLLDFYLDHYANEKSILSCSELDGFCHAIASAPNVIMPTEWLPAIWGMDDEGNVGEEPKWDSRFDANEFPELVFSVYNHATENLSRGNVEPLFYEPDEEGKSYDIANEWCAGFLRGGALWDEIDEADADLVQEPVDKIKLFATEEGFAQLDAMSQPEVARAQQEVLDGVNLMYKHFYNLRNKPQKREEPKVGRNDPCICGSGKKFKKCCMNK